MRSLLRAFNLLKAPQQFSTLQFKRFCQDSGKITNIKLGPLLNYWVQKFKKSSISEPDNSAKYILSHALDFPKVSDLISNVDKKLTVTQLEKVQELCRKRLKQMPIQYVLEEWDFRELTLQMRQPVFIPRPETEMLIDLVKREVESKQCQEILEFCCGTGAISLALLHEIPTLKATAIDQSLQACELTKLNAIRNGLENRITVLHHKLTAIFTFNDSKFDIIVSNPPYIPRNYLKDLQPEIRLYEDLFALDGGLDGLDLIKVIVQVASGLLKIDGRLFLEIDPSQPELIKVWINNNRRLGLEYLGTYKDFCGKDRFCQILKIGRI